jgi:hypothetical protein
LCFTCRLGCDADAHIVVAPGAACPLLLPQLGTWIMLFRACVSVTLVVNLCFITRAYELMFIGDFRIFRFDAQTMIKELFASSALILWDGESNKLLILKQCPTAGSIVIRRSMKRISTSLLILYIFTSLLSHISLFSLSLHYQAQP